MAETISITVTVDEFEDFLYQTLDDVAVQQGKAIADYLGSFLIGIGTVYITKTNGSISSIRF